MINRYKFQMKRGGSEPLRTLPELAEELGLPYRELLGLSRTDRAFPTSPVPRNNESNKRYYIPSQVREWYATRKVTA
jgi:hypothetical protein